MTQRALITNNEVNLRIFIRSLVDLPIDAIEAIKAEYRAARNMDGYLADTMVQACEKHLDIKYTIAGRSPLRRKRSW